MSHPEERTVELRVFCPTCGELKVNKYGMILHPAQDKIIAEIIKHGFTVKDVTIFADKKEKTL